MNNALPLGFCKLCNVCDVRVLLLFFVLSSCTVKPHSTRNLEVAGSSVVTVFSNTCTISLEISVPTLEV